MRSVASRVAATKNLITMLVMLLSSMTNVVIRFLGVATQRNHGFGFLIIYLADAAVIPRCDFLFSYRSVKLQNEFFRRQRRRFDSRLGSGDFQCSIQRSHSRGTRSWQTCRWSCEGASREGAEVYYIRKSCFSFFCYRFALKWRPNMVPFKNTPLNLIRPKLWQGPTIKSRYVFVHWRSHLSWNASVLSQLPLNLPPPRPP